MNYTAQHSMFEGLFERVLKPEGDFQAALEAAGYDVTQSTTEYPIEVWQACLDVSAKFLYPDAERPEAWRRIGKVFMAGYFETIVGRMIGAALPFLSARTFLQRCPRFVKSGLKEMEATVEWLSGTKARLVLKGPHAGACWVSASVLELCFEKLKVKAVITTRDLDAPNGEIVVDFTERALAEAA